MAKMKIVFLVTLFSVLSITRAAGNSAKPASEFAVNLDVPPTQRWTEIVSAYKSDIENLLKLIKKDVPRVLIEAIAVVTNSVDKLVPYPYNEEIVGIANALNTSIADILLANLYYELTAYNHQLDSKAFHSLGACTSIVAETTDEGIMHARNMDYSFVKYLLVTGQKPYKYTISLDERNKGTLVMNLAEMLLSRGMQGAVAFHVRDVLSSDKLTFREAAAYMADKLLIAPAYVIMGGANSGEGVVITRDRLDSLDQHWLNATAGTWYVLESETGLFNVLSTPPVFNHKTTYTVVMAAAQPEIYKTWVRFYA